MLKNFCLIYFVLISRNFCSFHIFLTQGKDLLICRQLVMREQVLGQSVAKIQTIVTEVDHLWRHIIFKLYG